MRQNSQLNRLNLIKNPFKRKQIPESMKQKLFIYAFISTPIFALYAISHPLIFGIVSLEMLAMPLRGILINIFIIWLINIYITLNFNNLSTFKKVLLSYGINLGFQMIFYAIGNLIPVGAPVGVISNYLLYPIITSIVINVAIIIICNAAEASYKKNEAELKTKELELENSEAQKKLLIQQLQPHFLFNSLSVLKSLIKENANQAEDYTLKLSDFLRYSIESHKSELVSLAEELKFVNDYIELQKVRFDYSFTYEVNIPDNVWSMKVPVFAIQTLVENAFKHNYFTQKRPLTIRIDYLNKKLTIWNNKVSIKVAEKTSTGLSNLNKRYELITEKQIEINETESSFSVTLPLI